MSRIDPSTASVHPKAHSRHRIRTRSSAQPACKLALQVARLTRVGESRAAVERRSLAYPRSQRNGLMHAWRCCHHRETEIES